MSGAPPRGISDFSLFKASVINIGLARILVVNGMRYNLVHFRGGRSVETRTLLSYFIAAISQERPECTDKMYSSEMHHN